MQRKNSPPGSSGPKKKKKRKPVEVTRSASKTVAAGCSRVFGEPEISKRASYFGVLKLGEGKLSAEK